MAVELADKLQVWPVQRAVSRPWTERPNLESVVAVHYDSVENRLPTRTAGERYQYSALHVRMYCVGDILHSLVG